MAKSPVRISGPARIRFVVVDAELPDGDVASIAQVLQNALRSPTLIPQRSSGAGNGAKTISHQPPQDPDVDVEESAEDGEEVESIVQPTKQRTTTRKPSPTPDVIDIDMNSDVSLATFAQGKDAKSQNKKYLIASAWLKEHRGTTGVTAGHIYTCFRSMEWPTNIADFWQPLRDLKSKKYFVRNDKNEYEINHLGLDYVKKLGGGNGTS